VGTLLDGNPRNNFLKRAVTFNPEGRLNGSRRITIAGDFAYILCDRGLEIVALADPLHPRIVSEVTDLAQPTGIAVQFRYAFVVDHEGLKVFDVTHLDRPLLPAHATYTSRAPTPMSLLAQMASPSSMWNAPSIPRSTRCSMPAVSSTM
jgi:hypothetical protein